MTHKEIYEYVQQCFTYDMSNPEGVDFEEAVEKAPMGWKDPVKQAFRYTQKLDVVLTRLYYKAGRMRIEWKAPDKETDYLMKEVHKYIYRLSRRKCLITGKKGIHTTFVSERPALSWEPRAAFTNEYFEEHGYDGWYEPEPDDAEHKISLRGRYRGGSPSLRHNSWKTGPHGSPYEWEPDKRGPEHGSPR